MRRRQAHWGHVMKQDDLHRWPRGERPASYGTPGAWEILDLLDRRQLGVATLMERLARYSARDLRGAYHLTRNLEELHRKTVLVEGEDAGRASRISARNLLRRAFRQARLAEEAEQLLHQQEALAQEILAAPPAPRGYRIRSLVQVLRLATSDKPLPMKTRQILEVRLDDLAAARASLQAEGPDKCVRQAGISELERDRIQRLLTWALDLLDQLGE